MSKPETTDQETTLCPHCGGDISVSLVAHLRRWAVKFDIEIASLIGDIGALDEEDTAAGRTKIAAYEQVREIIESMVI